MPSTATEQYLLELTNEARLDPLGSAARYISSYASTALSSASNITNALVYFGSAARSSLRPTRP